MKQMSMRFNVSFFIMVTQGTYRIAVPSLLLCVEVLLVIYVKSYEYSIASTDESVFQPKIIGGYPICLTHPDETFCELDPSYPLMKIRELLRAHRNIYVDEKLASSDNKVTNITKDPSGEFLIATLTANDVQSTCPHREVKINPPVARSDQLSLWVYIVNSPEYKQTVKGQKCVIGQGQDCDSDLPTSYQSGCIQKFKSTRLLAIHPTTKVPFEDTFTMPSHCECQTQSELFPKFRPNDGKYFNSSN